MKKQVYFTIIGIGALLAIIGWSKPGGLPGILGLLIAGVAGALYYFNKRTEERVRERLEGEKQNFMQGAGDESSSDDTLTHEEEPPEEKTDQ